MATVTIGRAYFEALLRRAQFHTSGQEFELAPDLSRNVTISQEEHEYLHTCSRDFKLIKSALFRGGLTAETLNTLLAGESEAAKDDTSLYDYGSENTYVKPRTHDTLKPRHDKDSLPSSDDTDTGSDQLELPEPRPLHRAYSHDQSEACIDGHVENGEINRRERNPHGWTSVNDQRTILITNLAYRTTHKDIAGVVRGGRLLDIFLRNDRSATVSFVEGAAEFLAYVKRNDIYLHAKRLEFRWADRQFNVTPHVFTKIASGASRNIVVRGIASRVSEEQIRAHLEHIHNLAVVDIYSKNSDVYISINSIHNALTARACMMSRTLYKGTRIDWAPDECAAQLPPPNVRARLPITQVPSLPLPTANSYALLYPSSDLDSDSQTESYMTNGVRLDPHDWKDAAVA